MIVPRGIRFVWPGPTALAKARSIAAIGLAHEHRGLGPYSFAPFVEQHGLAIGTCQFWKELSAPDPAVLIDIGSDPCQIRMTPDGKSYAYTYWTFEGELYLARGLK
jgi:hypothetical protein